MQQIDPDGLLRVHDIIGRKEITEADARRNKMAGKRGTTPRPAIRGLIPMSASTWWLGLKDGRFPQPDVRGPKVLYWRARTILELIDRMAAHKEAA